MRKLFLLLTFCCLSIITYPQSYSKLWKDVDSLQSIRNYKQSGEVVQKIRKKAIYENNIPEKVRTFLAEHYSLSINQNNENSLTIIDKHFQKNLNAANGIEKNLLANFYAQFLLNNINFHFVDSSHFAAEKIDNRILKIDSLFRLSLQNKQILYSESLTKWSTLFNSTSDSTLTPTLYHLLAINYLDFLKIDKTNQIKAITLENEIRDINKKYNFNDAQAYLIYRPFLQPNNDQIIFSSRRRGYNTSNIDSLKKLIPTIESNFNAHIYYLIAKQSDNKTAAQLLQTAKANYPHSPWINNVDTLYEYLNRVNLTVQAPSFVPSNEYTPIHIQHQNLDKIYIRVYDISIKSKKANIVHINHDLSTKQIYLQAPLVYEEKIDVKSFDDLNTHNTIYKINPLPYGRYQILMSNNPDFRDDGTYQQTISSNFFVSDLFISTYVYEFNSDNSKYRFFLLNRKSGKPQAYKKVELHQMSEAEDKLKKIKNFKTNYAGEFNFTKDFHHNGLKDIWLYAPEEKQWIDLDELSNVVGLEKNTSPADIPNQQRAILLTDRAIYRPGQPLYFKAILHTDHFENGKIMSNQDLKIILKDANNQEIKSLTFTTNAFGSINGQFDLPVQTLNGNFRLEVLQLNNILNSKHIRVEEYKRPTFKVDFEPNKNTYTKKDTAKFVGKVQSLSGAAIPNARIKYNIQVSANNPYKRLNPIDSITTTNADGLFEIKLALADTIYAKSKNLYIYINAEAISQSEEIQRANMYFHYDDQPRVLNILSPSVYTAFNWKNIQIKTSNKNGFTLTYDGLLKIYRYEDLRVPLNYDAFSFKTEYHILDSASYTKYFPNYYDIAKFREDRKKTLIATYPFDTKDTSIISIDSTLFGSGEYLIEGITNINSKDTVLATQAIHILDPKTGKSSANTFLAYRFDKNSYSENDTARLTIYSDLKDVQNVFIWRIKGTDIGPTQVVPFNGDKAVYEFIVDKNNSYPKSTLEILLLKDNKIQQQSIYIPYKENFKNLLTIMTKTFRDKITPGQKEKWTFTIKNNTSKAEVLATMYDHALDQFASNYFQDNFYLRTPYYNTHNLSHISREFDEKTFWNSFLNNKHKNYRSYIIPEIKNYGLWSNNIYPYTNLYFKKGLDGETIIEEVVVTAAAPRAKMTMTGSAAVINGQNIQDARATNFTDLLQGKVSGVYVEGSATGTTRGIESKITLRGLSSTNFSNDNYDKNTLPLFVLDGIVQNEDFRLDIIPAENIEEIRIYKDEAANALFGNKAKYGVVFIKTKSSKSSIDEVVAKIEQNIKTEELLNAIQARKDLKETAFFYPTLYTDENGDVSFEFDSPEALTKWKLMLFAHTEDLQAGTATFFTQTQKQLMVQPNMPRFMRIGDQIILKSLIHNLSDKALKGFARLQIIDPTNNKVIEQIIAKETETQEIDIEGKSNTTVSWKIDVPADHPSIIVEIVAYTDEFSDGEQHEIAIIPNNVLLSETQKIHLKPNEKKTFHIHSQGKDNLQTQIIMQTNPVLEILSALDYLKHYPYECAEQTASKWFGIKMIQYVDKHYPVIANYFSNLDTANISSSLRYKAATNELSLQEMPWLRHIVNDEIRLKQLALLFNKQSINQDLKILEDRLKKLQNKNGSFVWFEGGDENLRISTRILEIFGKVHHLDPDLLSNDNKKIINQLKSYLDKEDLFNEKTPYHEIIDYAYAQHYWSEDIVRNKEQKTWIIKTLKNAPLNSARQAAGIAAKSWIVAHHYGLNKESNAIFNRLNQEYVLDSLEGKYWKSNGTYYNAISLHTYLIEAYKVMKPEVLNSMADWLFYHKTHNNWLTTWMSVDAIYGLLLINNPAYFDINNNVSVWVDNKKASMQQSGIGQVSLNIPKEELNENKFIEIENSNNRKVYGSISHQYFEPLDKIIKTHNDISVSKHILVFRNNEWVSSNSIKSGEKIKIRIEVVANKALNFVHLKDNRAAGIEPEYRPSGYQRWRGSYYFTNKDASTNFFIDYLSKGRHIFEYEVKTNNIGVFNSGITQIECMYDPATNARSKNLKIEIKD